VTGELLVAADGRVHRFAHAHPVSVSRAADADVPLTDPAVSRLHLVAAPVPGGWQVEDVGSSGGTFLDGRPLGRTLLAAAAGEVQLRLGGPDGALVVLSVVPERPAAAALQDASVTVRDHAGAPVITIGRSRDADVSLHDLLVSRRHAQVVQEDGRAVLVDLDSANGTFVDGHRIRRHALTPGASVGVGNTTLTWTGRALELPVLQLDDALVAEELRVVTKQGRVLLSDASLSFSESSLVAVVGPSGAGKTTLLGALTGLRPARQGVVRWRGQDLYRGYEDLKRRIGLVPQEDTLHRQLTVRRGLEFAAALRSSPDTTAAERAAAVDRVLSDLQLTDQAAQRVDSLSGGQRKRVSIALELLTAPPLLFLDEPTSGLDPGTELQVVTVLRRLANEGRLVVVVTHSVQGLDDYDVVVVMAPGGRVAYAGPPTSLLEHFGATSYAEVFTRLPSLPAGADAVRSGGRRPDRAPSPPEPGPRGPAMLRQAATLVHRNAAVALADRGLLVLLLLLPLGLALLAHAVPGASGLHLPVAAAPEVEAEVRQRLVVLVFGGTLMGSALSVRELVGERSIYARERAVGLSSVAYLAAKAIVLGGLVAAASVAFTYLALAGQPGPARALLLDGTLPGKLEIALAVALAAVASMCAGLAVSAAVRTTEQTMPSLVGIVMTQLVLCGGLVPVSGRAVLEQLSWLAPARLGYAAMASTTGSSAPPGGARDALVAATSSRVSLLLGLLLVQSVVFLLVAGRLLRRTTGRAV